MKLSRIRKETSPDLYVNGVHLPMPQKGCNLSGKSIRKEHHARGKFSPTTWFLVLVLMMSVASVPIDADDRGPTYVSGIISTDVNWNVTDSPYIVTGNMLVASGSSLTIDPGVHVKFDGYYYLQIEGTLIANPNLRTAG